MTENMVIKITETKKVGKFRKMTISILDMMTLGTTKVLGDDLGELEVQILELRREKGQNMESEKTIIIMVMKPLSTFQATDIC